MGYEADAWLVYGVDLGEEVFGQPFWADEAEDLDFDRWIYKLNGVNTDHLWAEYAAYFETDEGKALNAEFRRDGVLAIMAEYKKRFPEWDAELQRLNPLRKEARENCPVNLASYGTPDESGHILYVRGAELRADGWTPQEITLDLFEMDVRKHAAAAQFVADNLPDIEWDPTWLMYAYLSY